MSPLLTWFWRRERSCWRDSRWAWACLFRLEQYWMVMSLTWRFLRSHQRRGDVYCGFWRRHVFQKSEINWGYCSSSRIKKILKFIQKVVTFRIMIWCINTSESKQLTTDFQLQFKKATIRHTMNMSDIAGKLITIITPADLGEKKEPYARYGEYLNQESSSSWETQCDSWRHTMSGVKERSQIRKEALLRGSRRPLIFKVAIFILRYEKLSLDGLTTYIIKFLCTFGKRSYYKHNFKRTMHWMNFWQ